MRRPISPRCLSLVLAGLSTASLALPAAALDRAPLPSQAAMEPCPAQGPGFARIPGTSTCIRVSGRVAAGADLGTSSSATPPVTGRFQVDTRIPTNEGSVRTFVRMGAGR